MDTLKKAMLRCAQKFGVEIRKLPSDDLSFPIEATSEQKRLILNAKRYSMTGIERMWALTQAYEYVRTNNILGDFVECGVWKGGNLVLLSSLQEYDENPRMIYGFDTFTGMTAPSKYDTDIRGVSAAKMMSQKKKVDGEQSIHAFASMDLVNQNLQDNESKNVRLIKGDVAKTLLDQSNLPSKISILRLDTDWYESTKIELELLYPLLASGGVLIIDDYGHYAGARKAVDEYFGSKLPWLHYVDYTCRLVLKE
jgi:hypothetical protein